MLLLEIDVLAHEPRDDERWSNGAALPRQKSLVNPLTPTVSIYCIHILSTRDRDNLHVHPACVIRGTLARWLVIFNPGLIGGHSIQQKKLRCTLYSVGPESSLDSVTTSVSITKVNRSYDFFSILCTMYRTNSVAVQSYPGRKTV